MNRGFPQFHFTTAISLFNSPNVKQTAHSDKYKALHQEFLHSKGVSWARLKPADSTQKSPWYQTCPNREKEVISYATGHVPNMISVDCSQRIDRASVGKGETLPTITPGGKTYFMCPSATSGKPLDRFLLGLEALRLQGFPVEFFDDIDDESLPSDPQMHDLAGNAFPSTVLCAVLLAIYLHLPSVVVATESDAESVDMDGIASLMGD